jgi:hypothetical protein
MSREEVEGRRERRPRDVEKRLRDVERGGRGKLREEAEGRREEAGASAVLGKQK